MTKLPKFNKTNLSEIHSQTIFNQQYSDNWILESIDKDFYGIDFLITKTEGDKILPIQKLIQLKSSTINRNKVVMPVHLLNFYKQLQLEVIIVFVSLITNELYEKSINNITIKPKQKWQTITF